MINTKQIYTIIVTYNGSKWMTNTLLRLQKSSIPVQTIIIDNGSVDDTKEIAQLFPEVRFIESKENLGFGRANNIGITIALNENAEYVFLLNQDAWVETETIEHLLNVAEQNPSYGIISPIHLNGSYTGLDIKFSEQVAPNHCSSFYSDMYVGKLKSIYEVEFINAAAWFISRNCIKKTGLFDPIFFLYGEDNNLLQRANFHGFKSGVTPLCTICHDREIRQGNFNETGIKNWERTLTLITLLNILERYSNCIITFLKMRISGVLKNIFQKNLSGANIQLKEITFFLFNFNKLKRLRNKHKIPGSNLVNEA